MNNISFNIVLLLIPICIASEIGGVSTGGDESHVGDLILMKSGKKFLRLLRKEEIWPNKDTEEESGLDYSNDDETEVPRDEKALLFCSAD